MTSKWTTKQIDDVYNGAAGLGALVTLILDHTTGFNRNKGMVKHVTNIFTGVGIGGSLAFVYLYYQGVYEEGFVPSNYAGTVDEYPRAESEYSVASTLSYVPDEHIELEQKRSKLRGQLDPRTRPFPYQQVDDD